MQKGNPRIVFAAGGTGGHLFPAISIAEEIKKIDSAAEFLFVGTRGKIEERIVPEHGYPLRTIWISGVARSFHARNFLVPVKIIVSLMQSLSLIRNFHPHVVVGTGGYVTGPVLFAASLLGIPTVIQEQNVSPGLTNRLLARWAKMAYLAFEASAAHFPTDITKVTGNPIRRTIGSVERESATYEQFGLHPELKTIFVMGGSQGAQAINRMVVDALKDLEPFHQQLQIIHQTGKADYKEVKEHYRSSPLKHVVQPYFDPIEVVYSLADLMVCRAGGMTISEITACGIPAIFIPLPTAAGDHQRLNAQAVADRGAGIVLGQATLTGAVLAEQVVQIITHPSTLQRMADASRQLGKPHAGEEIAKSIYALVKRNALEKV